MKSLSYFYFGRKAIIQEVDRMNVLEKAASILELLALTALIMILFLFWSDTQQERFIDRHAASFDEDVRYEGYIDQEMYEFLMDALIKTGTPYRVMIQHIRWSVDENGIKAATIYKEQIILEEIYGSLNGRYKMERGDDFLVVVSSLQPSHLDSFWTALNGKGAPIGKVISAKGGRIEHASY